MTLLMLMEGVHTLYVSVPLVHKYPVRQVSLVATTIVLSFIAAASYIVYRSPVAPLLTGLALYMGAVIVVWFMKPIWALYATLIVVFLPIGILPDTWQANLNRGMTAIAFVVWVLATLMCRRRITITGTAFWMIAFIVWSSATLIWARDLDAACIGIQTYVLRFVLFLVLFANQVRTREALDGLMRTLALCGLILVGASVATISSTGYSPGERFQVFGMNENTTGVLALITMVGILWPGTKTYDRTRRGAKVIGLVFIGLALVVTAITGSRGSALSFVVTLAALWLWRPTRVWGIMGVLLLIVAFALIPSIFATLAARFAVEPGDTLLGHRELLWQAAWTMILDRPWLGIGINNAPRSMVNYAGAAIGIGQHQVAAVHNPVLSIWAETGTIGLMIYLGVLVSAMTTFARGWLSDRRVGRPWLRPYYGLVSAVTLGYLVSWIIGGGLESDRTYFLLLALLVLPSHLENGTG